MTTTIRCAGRGLAAVVILICTSVEVAGEGRIDRGALKLPILLGGDKTTAYRDPTAVYHDGIFYLYLTVVRTEEENRIYSDTALSRSSSLRDWSKPRMITPKGQMLNYSSPGNVVRFGGEWMICLQTYPRPDYRRGGGVRWADGTARGDGGAFISRTG